MIESNGHIILGTSICVDFWFWTPGKKYHHFLTHLHADHTVNLTSTFCEPIYTSRFNAWLLTRWFNINPEHIIAIDVGESHLVCDEDKGSLFSVTLLDANHCPGAVMFLFQGTFGNILYTGDFRYHPGIFGHPMLKSLIENEAVDRLYLDNTFAAEHCEFPSREKALEDLINLIKAHPDHNVILGVRRLGKEEALRAVALELKEKICVSEDKMRILTRLRYENVFTKDPEESRIFVKEMSRINSKFIDQLRAERGPVITIFLTAIYSVIPPQAKHLGLAKDTDQGVHKIPYSDHSCHSELVEFVSRIKPKQIIPIVSISGSKKANSRQNCDQSDIRFFAWQNSLISERIMELSENPHQWQVINPEPIGHRKSQTIGNLEFKHYSQTTSDKVEASSRVQAVKFQIQEKSKDNMNIIGVSAERPNIIMGKDVKKRKHPVNVNYSASKSKNQRNCLIKNPSHTDSEIAVGDSETCEEYFALSDEDLSQIEFKSKKQKFCPEEKSSHALSQIQPSNPRISGESFTLFGEHLSQIGVAYDQNGNSCSNLTSKALMQLECRNAKFDALSLKGNCINQQNNTSILASTETEQNMKSDKSKHCNSVEQTTLALESLCQSSTLKKLEDICSKKEILENPISKINLHKQTILALESLCQSSTLKKLEDICSKKEILENPISKINLHKQTILALESLCQSSTLKKLEDICSKKEILENPISKINLHKDNNLPQLDESSLEDEHQVNVGQSRNSNIMPPIEVSSFKPSKSISKTLTTCHTDVSSLTKISPEDCCSKLKDVNKVNEEDERGIYKKGAAILNRIFQPPKRTKDKPLSYCETQCQARHAFVNRLFEGKASTTEKEISGKNFSADAVDHHK